MIVRTNHPQSPKTDECVGRGGGVTIRSPCLPLSPCCCVVVKMAKSKVRRCASI